MADNAAVPYYYEPRPEDVLRPTQYFDTGSGVANFFVNGIFGATSNLITALVNLPFRVMAELERGLRYIGFSPAEIEAMNYFGPGELHAAGEAFRELSALQRTYQEAQAIVREAETQRSVARMSPDLWRDLNTRESVLDILHGESHPSGQLEPRAGESTASTATRGADRVPQLDEPAGQIVLGEPVGDAHVISAHGIDLQRPPPRPYPSNVRVLLALEDGRPLLDALFSERPRWLPQSVGRALEERGLRASPRDLYYRTPANVAGWGFGQQFRLFTIEEIQRTIPGFELPSLVAYPLDWPGFKQLPPALETSTRVVGGPVHLVDILERIAASVPPDQTVDVIWSACRQTVPPR